MILLSLDTSTRFGSMGIYDVQSESPKVLAQKGWEGFHSEVITDFLNTVLLQAQVKVSDLEAIFVGIGPGSFTGLRVGVNLVKALSYSLSTPIWAFNSLSVLAWPHRELNTLSLVKAQQNIFYVGARMAQSKGFREILSPTSMTEENVWEYIDSHYGKAKGLPPLEGPPFEGAPQEGGGCWEHGLVLCGLVSEGLRLEIQRRGREFHVSPPSAKDLLDYGLFCKDSMKPLSWKELIPLYVRASAAEEKEGTPKVVDRL